MPTTANKGYEVQVTGSNSGTWGDTLNDDVFGIIDENLGGITTKTLASSNVALTVGESQAAILRLTGTLTANVQVTTLCIGFFFVENLTAGDFTVTLTNGAGSSYVVPQSTRTTLISDSTNGVRPADASLIPAGTVMLFVQSSSPTGWTKSASHNNKALRVVSGAASSGGTTSFSEVFTSRTIAIANLPSHGHTITINDPGHSHALNGLTVAAGGGSVPAGNGTGGYATAQNTTGITATASNTGSGTAMDFAVQYVDVIIATKD